MHETLDREQVACPECANRTVVFRGRGKNLSYWICPRYEEPGHLTMLEVKERIKQEALIAKPNGRFA